MFLITYLPMITIRPLTGQSVATLTQTFNEAFSDYDVPLQITEAQLADKLMADQIDLTLSPGAFDQDRLVGFIWHGIEGDLAWNGGTGVVPSYRGQRITDQLYAFILPHLRAAGIKKTVLEVLQNNHPAVHIYQKNGFVVQRELDCFLGSIKVVNAKKEVDIRMVTAIDPHEQEAFRDWLPTFQNRDQKLINLGNKVIRLGAYVNDQIVAYLVADSAADKGSIYQFAV